MGAGIAAVAGIEHELSSCCAAIEEAHSELRQELSGRNERQRELEFLEKGGNPLEFQFGESRAGLWSLSPKDPFAKQRLPSDGKGIHPVTNLTKEDAIEYSPEDGSEFKRARSITGKFCFVDCGATTISIESTPPDALPTSISSSIEHDRKDVPKKEFDVCKSNKGAIKGQYARRNRQRSNRFGNGCSVLQDSVKFGAEGGSSSYSSGVKGFLTNDPDTKNVIKEKLTQDTADQDALESSDADVVACAREGKEKAVAFDDHPDYDMAVQVCEPLLLQTTHKADTTYLEKQNEDLRTMNQLPSSLQCNVEEGRNLPSSCLFNMEEERNLSPSIQCGVEEAKNSATVGSTHGPLAMPGTEKNKEASDESAESNLEPKSMEKPSNGGISEVNHVAEYEGISNKGNQEDKVSTNDHMALPAHQSTIDRTQTLTASECKERHDNETNSMAAMSTSSILGSTSGSHVLEEKVHAIGCDKIIKNGLFGKAQGLEEFKIKVEDEMPDTAVIPSVARASLSDVRPANLSMPQEATTVPPQYPEEGNASSGHVVADALQVRVSDANGFPTDNLPIVALPREEEDLRTLADGTSDIKTNFSVAAKKAHKDSTAHEAEEIKEDSLRQSADWAKRRAFQEPPRKKSHWDFVLEEMAWLANDFMQERLWKIASAAQVARWVVREKWQLEFQEAELCNRQCKIARTLAKTITKFWHSIEALLLRDAARADSALMACSSSTKTDQGTDGEGHKAEAETVKPRINKSKAPPVQAYAIRFLENSLGRQPVAQAEAPPTPDRVSESGMFEFWEDQFPEESLFYTVPNNAMEIYRQSAVSQWEAEYEQRIQEHEAALTETEVHVAAETTEYSTGIYGVAPLVSQLVTGKRSSGFHGGSYTNVGSIPTKRTRTSAVAARQRAAGATGPLVSGSATHLARSDISSCETNSQQDEMTTLLEGSSVSGRLTDVDSNGAFVRNNMAADGVDSPFKSKKKKKTRHFNGGHNLSAAYNMRESEQLWQHNVHRQSDQREHSKHKGEQISQIGIGSAWLEGLGATPGASHGAASVTSSASKLMKQITSRDRGRKYKAGKASLSQPGFGIPWSAVEDQAILRLVYELGMNWELVSDILSSNSQLKGVFRKPKDCKERYKLLTDRLGGDGGDSPDDPGSSTHLPISVTQKGGTRLWPQHLEETLKNHVDCILHLHQQLRSRKLQIESQEPKQLVPEHESHASKHTSLHSAPLTPLELCELSSTTGELVSLAYPLQPAHGNGLGIPSIMSSGIGMRPTSSAMSVLHGANNLQLSPSMSPSPGINATATRDAHRMGASMRPLTEEEQRLRYSRMVAGRGLQTQGLSVTSGLPLMGLPSATDSGASSMLPSGNSAGVVCGLSRGMPVTRTGLPGMGSIGVPNISASMNNVLPSVGMGLSGTGAVNPGAVSSPVSMMRRPMGHSLPAALNNLNSSLSSPVVSSPTQNLTAQQQQQLLQHNTLHAQQQSPSSSQQQAYNMMRVTKERQQLQQQQQQKRMLQQQSSPTSNSSQSPFQSSQPLPVSQQQHVLSPHAHMFSQLHQPSHLLMQQHVLQQEAGPQQQQAIGPIPSANVLQSAPSPSAQPSLNGNSQNPQQQLLSQAHQPASSASSTQPPVQTKQQHQNLSAKQQQQQQQQGKNIKGMGRGASMQGQSSMLPSQLSAQLSGQQMAQGQRMVQSQGSVPSGGQLTVVPQTAVQNLTVNLSQVADAVVQQYQQKGFSQHLSGKLTPISTCPPIQPTSPPTGVSAPQQQPSPVIVASLTSTQQQQRRASQQSQTQQRRPQQREAGSSIGTQLSSQPGKNGLQPSSVPSQLPGQPVHVGFQLGSSMNNPLSMASPSGGIPLSSPSTAGSGSVPSPQWKPGQNFSPMAAGLYNLSRNNSGAAAQAPHLAMSMGMLTPSSNGNIPVTGNSLVTHEISRGGSQHALGHVGTPSQKPSVGSTTNARAMPASQHMAPSQRQLAQQQQLSCMPNSTGGSQVGPSSSGTTPGTE